MNSIELNSIELNKGTKLYKAVSSDNRKCNKECWYGTTIETAKKYFDLYYSGEECGIKDFPYSRIAMALSSFPPNAFCASTAFCRDCNSDRLIFAAFN